MTSVAVLGRPLREEGLLSDSSSSESEKEDLLLLQDPKQRLIRAAWRSKWTRRGTRRPTSVDTTLGKDQELGLAAGHNRLLETQFDLSPSALTASALSAPSRSTAIDIEGSASRRKGTKTKVSGTKPPRTRTSPRGVHEDEERPLVSPRPRRPPRRKSRLTEANLRRELDAHDTMIAPAAFNRLYAAPDGLPPRPLPSPVLSQEDTMVHSRTWPALAFSPHGGGLDTYWSEPYLGSPPPRPRTGWLDFGCCRDSRDGERFVR